MRRSLRLLPLPLSIAIALPALADEKPVNWNLCPATDALPAFSEAPPANAAQAAIRDQLPTEIEGDSLSGTSTTPEYSGDVLMRRGDQFIGADVLRTDTETGNYIAEGRIRYSDSRFRVSAQRAEGNSQIDSHRISEIQYQLIDRRGNGTAGSIDLQGAVGQVHDSTYTTCDPSQVVWRLDAPDIEFDNDTGFGTARNAVLRVGKVPVLWAPYFKFPIDERRQTGLLYPKIGLSGRNGFDYAQPIYFNIAPNLDDTLTPQIMTERGVAIDNELRWLYHKGRGQLDTMWMHDDKLRERDRSRIDLSAYHNINRIWQARSSIRWVSDERYVEDFSNIRDGQNESSLISTVGVYGSGRDWQAGAMVDHYRLTDYTLTESSLPYHREPRLYARWDKALLPWLEAGIWTEAVRFSHDDVRLKDADYNRTGVSQAIPGGSRLDIKPYLSMPLAGAAWYVTPTLAWRHTAYQLDAELADQFSGDRSPSRSLPITTVDAGLFFDRQTSIDGKPFLHTLEPRLFYLNVPYRDQSGMPLFDTRAFTFSWGQLFRDSRYTGPDRQNDANQLTMALSTRLIDQQSGREKLSASIGQIQYFEDSQVTLNQNEVPVEQGKSAWVADLNWAITDRWTVGTTYQWNPSYRKEDLASLRATYLLPEDGIVNLGYRYRRNPRNGEDQLEQVDFSFLYPINPRWSVVGRYYHSLLDDKPLEVIGGVQWDSCCLAVRALVRRHVRNREGDMDNSIQVEFVLKGLSSFGQNTDRALSRAILGYNRDDLYLVPPSRSGVDSDDYDPNLIP